MRVIFYTADHEISQVAEFMREDVDETVGIVDDFFREFDVGNVSVFSTDGAVLCVSFLCILFSNLRVRLWNSVFCSR